MWIAPSRHAEIGNWTDAHWKKLTFSSEDDWDTAIEIFEDRIKYRYLDAIQVLQDDDTEHYCTHEQRRFGFAMMALACLLADQFSIITVLHQSLPEIERQIARYGLGDRATPGRAVEIHVLELDAQHERLLTEFGQEVVGAIEEDGAHLSCS